MIFHADRPLSELTVIYSKTTSKFLEIENLRVHYCIDGKEDGPVLLLLHGILSSLHTWDGWVESLRAHFRIIRLDLPGFGLTGPPQTELQNFSIEFYVSFLRQFLDALKIKNCFVAGNSLGGWITWRFTAKFPSYVQKMILLNAAGYDLRRPPRVVQFTRLPIIREIFANYTPTWLARLMVKSVYGDPQNVSDILVNRYRDLCLREGNRRFFTLLVRSTHPEDTAELKKLQVPTLILWGEKDRWIPVRNALLFKKDIIDSTLEIFSGLGHVTMEEAPEETAKQALKFLQS